MKITGYTLQHTLSYKPKLHKRQQTPSYLLVDESRILQSSDGSHALCMCVRVTSRLHSVCLSAFDQHTSKPEESTAQTILFGPRGTEARYCVKQSGVKTHKSIPRCFPTLRFAVGEINNCGLRSGFSSLSWPFHLSSSYCTVVYSTPQKTDSSSTIFGFRHFSCLLVLILSRM